MNERRREWIYNSLRRDLKMIDTQILSGLQNGTGFFASTSIFAIGSCFALLGATDKINAFFSDMPFIFNGGRTAFEIKVAGLACLFGYAFSSSAGPIAYSITAPFSSAPADAGRCHS